MKEEKMNWVSVIKFAGAYIAFIIGSGFASGQEILQFFTSYGLLSVGGVLISMFLFAWVGGVLMQRGFRTKDNPEENSFRYYFGDKISILLDWFISIFLYCVVVVMVSGAGATVNEYFGPPQWVGSAIMAVIVIICVIMGLQKLIDIVGCIGPVIIVFTLFITIISLVKTGGNLSASIELSKTMELPKAANFWWLAGLLYVAYNAAGSVPFLTSMGYGANSRKEAKWGGIIGGIVLMVAALMLNLAMLANIEEVGKLQIPSLYLAKFVSPVLGTIFSIILLCGIFSTAAPMLWISTKKFAKDGTTKHKILTLILGVIAFVGGQLPFGTLVGTLYPYTGYLGIIVLIVIAVKTYIIKDKPATGAAKK